MYVGNIAFFASADGVHSSVLDVASVPQSSRCLTAQLVLNVSNSALLFLSPASFLYILLHRSYPAAQVDSVKYLDIIYWRPQIICNPVEGELAFGRLARTSKKKIRYSSLHIGLYRTCVLPVLEFGCVLSSGYPRYSFIFYVLWRDALCDFASESQEQWQMCCTWRRRCMPDLNCRLHLLTVQTFLWGLFLNWLAPCSRRTRVFPTPIYSLDICSQRLYSPVPDCRKSQSQSVSSLLRISNV